MRYLPELPEHVEQDLRRLMTPFIEHFIECVLRPISSEFAPLIEEARAARVSPYALMSPEQRVRFRTVMDRFDELQETLKERINADPS
jgi:hypothetical protein